MADHYVALARGVSGTKYSDFTVGTSAAGGSTIELRVPDGAGVTLKDIELAIEAFERFFADNKLTTAAGIVYSI